MERFVIDDDVAFKECSQFLKDNPNYKISGNIIRVGSTIEIEVLDKYKSLLDNKDSNFLEISGYKFKVY